MSVLLACGGGSQARAEDTVQPGLTWQRFNGENLDRPTPAPNTTGTALDISVLGVGDSGFSIRFTGSLMSTVTGVHNFRFEADTGVRLKVDGMTVVDGWSKNGPRTGTASLTKDQRVDLVIEYFFDRPGGGTTAELRLFWTPPGSQEVRVPANAYSHVSVPPAPTVPPVIEVTGSEMETLNLKLPHGGLKPMVGVHNIQVLRTHKTNPSDGDGWTWAHHQDLAVWKGKLYVAWAMTRKDEDTLPYKVLYATSENGTDWSAPASLFPDESAWATRFYFYRATNGRMLAFSTGKTEAGVKNNVITEAIKKVLLVREISSDHQLGPVYVLVAAPGEPNQPPLYTTATDPGFLAAAQEAHDNRLLLEQQDLGKFLGNRRMKWHEDSFRPKSAYGSWAIFGKAFCFYRRADGKWVGLSKVAFTTLSADEGETWSKPAQPPTLTAGSSKVWGQRTADNRFALVYNPDPGRNLRWPLVMVHGEDGREFRDMRTVHGEVTRMRYEGKWKDIGAQYMRGLAEWADDGTFADSQQSMWLTYSLNKEDIWVARVPLPFKADETVFPTDDFTTFSPGKLVPGWNLYSPKWAPVAIVADGDTRCLELLDGDPYDYARAVRVFPEAAQVRAELRLKPSQASARLEIELCIPAGRRPARVSLTENGSIQASDGAGLRDLGPYAAGVELTFTLTTDLAAGLYTVQVNDGPVQALAVAEAGCLVVQRISLRTGAWRGIGEGGPVDPTTDVPLAMPAKFQVHSLTIQPL